MRRFLLASSFFIASLAQAGDVDITREHRAPATPAATTVSSPTTHPIMATIEQRVVNEVVAALRLREAQRSKFSRMRMPPRERQVRATSTTVLTDAKGNRFVPFAIDARFSKDDAFDVDHTGCVYIAGDIFIAIGDSHRPAQVLAGKPAEAAPGACVAAQPST